MMSVGMRDSINMYLLSDSLALSIQSEKLNSLKYYLQKSLMAPETLPVPMSGAQANSITKGVEGFYKNDRGMKYEGRGWYDAKANELAAKRAMDGVKRNLSGMYKTPAFLKKLSSSDNTFLRLIGGLLGILDNGARAQAAPSYGNNTLTMMPMVGGAPIREDVKYTPQTTDADLFEPSPRDTVKRATPRRHLKHRNSAVTEAN